MNLSHCVVTRLGIGVLNEAWLRERLKLLEATVVPSLHSQSEKNFRWLVGVGNDMPAGPKGELKALLAQDARFEIVEIDHLREGFIPRKVLQALHAAEGGLITTRIDDDDALHRLAIEEIRTAAEEQYQRGAKEALIYHPLGYELQLKMMQAFPLELHGPSMGLTMLSVAPTYRDAYSLNHMRTRNYEAERKVPRVLLQPDRPSWLYLRHLLGDSSRGGEHLMSSGAGTPLDESFMTHLEETFGILPEKFRAAISSQSQYSPRRLDDRKTLLNERWEVMDKLREILKEIDRHASPPAELSDKKEALYADYLRLSQLVFD